MHGRHLAGDNAQEFLTIAFQLFRTNAIHARHLIQRARAGLGHLDQGAVGKDHIGRHARRLGQRPALGLKRRKQRRVLFIDRGADDHGRPGTTDQITAQRDTLFPAQHGMGGGGNGQPAMALGVGADQVAAQHLANDRLPLRLRQVATDTKCRQPIMAALTDTVGHGAGQHVDHMTRAIGLAGAQNGRKHLLHRLCRVETLGRNVADVAIPTGRGGFPEIAQQSDAPTSGRLGQPQQRIQPGMIGGLAFGRGQPLVDLPPTQADVVGAVKRQRLGRGTIAAATADLLIIGLDRLGQVRMRDPANVGLVDAHAKSDRGHHDQPILALEPRLDLAAGLALHTAMIGGRGQTRLVQRGCQCLGLGAGAAIDDARLSAPGGGEIEDLPARSVLGLEGQMDIRPIKAAQEYLWLRAVEQPRHDLVAGLGIGGGGKGGQGHAQRPAQLANPQIIGAEVMPPLADAMRLVHGDGLHPGAAQHRHGRPGRQPLGRHVKQPQFARIQRPHHLGVLFLGIAAGQGGGSDARFGQCTDLIAHQGDQRRNHHRQPVPYQCGQLIAQRLAAAGRHDRQHVAAGRDGIHDLFLPRPKGVEAEDLPQKGGGRHP